MNVGEVLSDYFTFLKFRTISSDRNCEKEMNGCALWLSEYLKKGGLDAEVIKTSSYPVVIGKTQHIEGMPTILFYGHYDVQDVEPLGEWGSDPFDPVVKDGVVYARGAVDNKGQVFYFINAVIDWLKLNKGNLNIKICIEGEEESGSLGLEEKLIELKDRLACDYLVVVDCDMLKEDRPAVTLGVRGILPFEVEVRGADRDLHSGSHGGMVYSAAKALVQLLDGCWDTDGRVKIPHFYDDVKGVSEEELKRYYMELDDEKYKSEFGIRVLERGKRKNSLYDAWFEPTLEINGIRSGHIKEGMKTIIPAAATAKLSCRLVVGQKIDKLKEVISNFFHKKIIKGMDIDIRFFNGGEAVKGEVDSYLVESLVRAHSEVFNKGCEKVFMGGSVPIVGKMHKVLGCEVAMMGMELLSDGIHGPNEHFSLKRLSQGHAVILKFLTAFNN
jgi:acetylornithine deacetylase/succinyl-diaminopimelate desuccinylase-like protein